MTGEMQVTTVDDFTSRARRARRARQGETDTNLGFKEIGIEVGRVLRSAPVQAGTVRRWFRDVVPSDLDSLYAMAVVLNVDAGWLAFGERSQAPAPAWFTPRQPDGGVDDDPAPSVAAAQAARQLSEIRKAGREHRRGRSA